MNQVAFNFASTLYGKTQPDLWMIPVLSRGFSRQALSTKGDFRFFFVEICPGEIATSFYPRLGYAVSYTSADSNKTSHPSPSICNQMLRIETTIECVATSVEDVVL